MKKKTAQIILEGAKSAFYYAMQGGYARGNKPQCVDGCKNHKRFTTLVGDYEVIDEWWTSPSSNRSAGTTTILFKSIPVWWMTYSGWYPKKAIPFLRKMLAESYRLKLFVGGRGPTYKESRCHRFAYQNYCQGKFENFTGMEWICLRKNLVQVGRHDYRGMSLLKV